MKQVTIVDYGVGNLLSVSRGFQKFGAEVNFASSAAQIESAQRLVLPGVGAFADGMQGLREKGFISPLREFAKSGRPFLGICLGMQMLLEEAEEFGRHEGLGLISGRVQAIPNVDISGRPHKIPHIGWSDLEIPNGATSNRWEGSILQNVKPGASAYFVHSFTAFPKDEKHRLADVYYGGQRISAALESGRLWGCQFHPEKSGEVGLSIIQAFLNTKLD